MEISKIRYQVFEDPKDDEPWVCRLYLDSTSPKGRKTYWIPINSRDHKPIMFDAKILPYLTPIEALEEYQLRCLFFWPHEKEADRRKRLRHILWAEKLKEKYLEKSNTLPMHAVASSG